MRPYYITKRANGYYRIRLIDQKTGLITCDRNTHTKDRGVAESIAVGWMIGGVPDGMINARKISLHNYKKKTNNSFYAILVLKQANQMKGKNVIRTCS